MGSSLIETTGRGLDGSSVISFRVSEEGWPGPDCLVSGHFDKADNNHLVVTLEGKSSSAPEDVADGFGAGGFDEAAANGVGVADVNGFGAADAGSLTEASTDNFGAADHSSFNAAFADGFSGVDAAGSDTATHLEAANLDNFVAGSFAADLTVTNSESEECSDSLSSLSVSFATLWVRASRSTSELKLSTCFLCL